MLKNRPSCYNCVHHSLCKYEPDWISFPTHDDKQAKRWFHIVPTIVAEVCHYFEERKDGN